MQQVIKPSLFFAATLAALLAAILLVWATAARANPSYFYGSNGTATTTVTYMTPGTATTTDVLKVQAVGTSAADNAALLVQFTGSSTLSTLNIALEYSNDTVNDCAATPTACDWYGDATMFGATTTQAVSLNPLHSYTLQFASTTVGGAAGTATRTTRVLRLETPTMWVRAVATVPIGSTNGAVWLRFIGRKQVN